MKKLTVASFVCAMAVSMSSMAADSASWTGWTPGLSGTQAGTFMQNGTTVNVTYTGDNFGIDYGAYIFDDVPGSFGVPTVLNNTPGSNGTVLMTGGNATINKFTFSSAVIDPVLALWSVGQGGVAVTFNFLDHPTFSVVTQGAGHWGGGSLIQSGDSVTGLEGNGLLQFKGTFTELRFTTPNYENYYGATVGALATAVPEPETYALLLAGLVVVGAALRSRSA